MPVPVPLPTPSPSNLLVLCCAPQSGVIQCCLVLGSGMLCWFFHATEEGALGYGYL